MIVSSLRKSLSLSSFYKGYIENFAILVKYFLVRLICNLQYIVYISVSIVISSKGAGFIHLIFYIP